MGSKKFWANIFTNDCKIDQTVFTLLSFHCVQQKGARGWILNRIAKNIHTPESFGMAFKCI